MLVWIDLETTGLDPHTCFILEVAMVISDDDLNVIDQRTSCVLGIDPRNLIAAGSDFDGVGDCPIEVWEGHLHNGLLQELRDMGERRLPVAYVQHILLDLLNRHVPLTAPMAERPLLAGSTISFDRSFLAVHMPQVLARLHYRNIDVSTVMELAQRWKPDLQLPKREGKHRALADIHESIELLRFLRTRGFIGGSPC